MGFSCWKQRTAKRKEWNSENWKIGVPRHHQVAVFLGVKL